MRRAAPPVCPEPAPPEKNLLLCCITRGNEIKIPRGGDEIQVGDNVIVVTLEHGCMTCGTSWKVNGGAA